MTRSRRHEFREAHDRLERAVDGVAALAHQLDYADRVATSPDEKRREQARKATRLADDLTGASDEFGGLLDDLDEDGDD